MQKETVTPYIPEEKLLERVRAMAAEIEKDFEGAPMTLVCVLKGSVFFSVELAKCFSKSVELDFIETSSYGNSTESTGIIKFVKDLTHPITDKNVLLIEDIIDSGNTLGHLQKHLLAQNPNTLKICTLLDKPSRRTNYDCVPDYVGFQIPDEFVVGFGLDYAQKYRNLPYIGILSFSESE